MIFIEMHIHEQVIVAIEMFTGCRQVRAHQVTTHPTASKQ